MFPSAAIPPFSELLRSQPIMRDVTAHHSEERAEKAERAGRHGGQRAPRVAGSTCRRERAEVARRLAAHEPDRHPEHTKGDDDAEDRRPADDGERSWLVILRLDRELRRRRGELCAADLGGGEGLGSKDQPVGCRRLDMEFVASRAR